MGGCTLACTAALSCEKPCLPHAHHAHTSTLHWAHWWAGLRLKRAPGTWLTARRAGDNINVNCVLPGAANSAFSNKVLLDKAKVGREGGGVAC